VAHEDRNSTWMGVGAILIWSFNIGVSRSLAESVGAMTSGALMFLLGGAIGCLHAAVVERRLRAMLRLPAKYLLGCGAIFAAYVLCLFLAVGLSATRQQTIEVAILNYLWPSLTLVLAIPLLGAQVGRAFPVGVAMALVGAALAPIHLDEWSSHALLDSLRAHPWPYVLAACAAVLWSLYSNLSRKWAGSAEGGAVALFSVASGLLLLAVRGWAPEPVSWTPRAVGELLFMALLPSLIAYSMWDRAVRRGNVTLVAALSYAIPVLSTLVSSLYLHVAVAWNVWAGATLVVVGAVVCQRSLRSASSSTQPA